MKVAIILGTRPEIIKLAPIVRACEKKKIDYFIVHSGQHYSPNMDAVFFEDLKLPKPKYNLHIGTLEYRKRVGKAMTEFVKIYENEWPDAIIVQGDTFTVLFGALSAKKLDRPVAHLEAGLRSHDLSMPEENNRIITDHVAEFLYPPTADAAKNIEDEGLAGREAPVFGNTVIDAVLQHAKISEDKESILPKYGLKPKQYVLVTAHRQENVDDKYRLTNILQGLVKVKKANPSLTIFFPLHPRTEKMMEKFGLKKPNEIKFAEPVGYLDFLQLEKNAKLFITDSGGLQEEATAFKIPCVTIRDNTERPETITAGMNVLAGVDSDKILECAQKMMKAKINWKPLYGDGTTAEKVMDDLEARVKKRKSVKERAKWVISATGRLIGNNSNKKSHSSSQIEEK